MLTWGSRFRKVRPHRTKTGGVPVNKRRELEPEQLIWREFQRAGGKMPVEEAREMAREHSGGHARRLGNLVQGKYIAKLSTGDYVVTEKGKRHLDRTITKGLLEQ